MSYIVGICGGSGSGKTTLARNLLEELKGAGITASLISFDDYYKHEPGMTEEERVQYNFDVPEAFDGYLLVEHLAKLKAGQAAEIPQYDFTTQSRRAETTHVEPADVIIVEGVLIFAEEEIRESFDLTVYVDAPLDVRLLRRIVRDIDERAHTARSAAAMYLNTVREAHEIYVEPFRTTSDIVVNDVFNKRVLEILVGGIARKTKE